MPYGLIQASSKGAIDQVSRTLAGELGARQITVNTISPGPIDTELLRGSVSAHKLQFIANIHPQKRLGTPMDIAPLVAFLAGPEAAWLSGQNIHVNGVRRWVFWKSVYSLTDSFMSFSGNSCVIFFDLLYVYLHENVLQKFCNSFIPLSHLDLL